MHDGLCDRGPAVARPEMAGSHCGLYDDRRRSRTATASSRLFTLRAICGRQGFAVLRSGPDLMKIVDVMSDAVEFVAAEASVKEAAELMGELDVGGLPVGTPENLEGMLTD